jgi:hypothetical protein
VVLATSFCVNLRFVVFSAPLRPYMMHLGFRRRVDNCYFMADMNYALMTQRSPQPARDTAGRAAQEACILGGGVPAWCSWVFPSLASIALINAIPATWGLGFADILALLGIHLLGDLDPPAGGGRRRRGRRCCRCVCLALQSQYPGRHCSGGRGVPADGKITAQ